MDHMVALIIFVLTFSGLAAFFLLFAVTSRREKRLRASVLAGSMAAVCAALLIIMAVPPVPAFAYWILSGLVVFIALLYFAPLNKPSQIKINGPTERVDERDIMFAREEYRPGTDKYQDYYDMRPANKEFDDRLRKLPEMFEPGGKYYEEETAKKIAGTFRKIERLGNHVDGKEARKDVNIDPAEATAMVKQMALELGAGEVGIARLNPMYVYSHVGRGPERWGAPIETTHRFAIVFTLEMDYNKVETAPALPITDESARRYLEGAEISIEMARRLREMGYSSRAHIAGSNYQIMVVPVAYEAGLGELGRFGYLISKKYGARCRLGAITTEMPLVPDKPVAFGVQDFCAVCKRCAEVCPSNSIPDGPKTDQRGVEKWQLDFETCIWAWRLAGTDCGLCMKYCPYSHPRALVHDVVKFAIERSAFARRVSAWGEKIFYGG